MRGPLLRAFLLVPLCAAAADMPSRRAGLWEITTTMAELRMRHTTKQCVDAATDARMMEMNDDAQAKGGMACTTSGPHRVGSGIETETTCKGNGMSMTSRSVFTGDFESSYKGETTTTFSPRVAGMAEQHMTMDARWVGPCEAGQVPGDIIMPGGMKVNVDSM